VAYVGTEIQDIFGIDAGSLQRATTFSDTFFPSSTAVQTLAHLVATPNGLLVSDETAKNYSIVPGDRVLLIGGGSRSRAVSAIAPAVFGLGVEVLAVGCARVIEGGVARGGGSLPVSRQAFSGPALPPPAGGVLGQATESGFQPGVDHPTVGAGGAERADAIDVRARVKLINPRQDLLGVQGWELGALHGQRRTRTRYR